MSERKLWPWSISTSGPTRTVKLTWLLAILLMAAFLRLWQLERVPPGLTHDEANNVHDAVTVLEGERPVYFPVAQGKEPLYPYSIAALMSILGRSPWVMRLTSAFWGLFLVVFSYAWARRAFGPIVAPLMAAGLATGFWPVTTSRMGLRAVALPTLFTTAIYFLWRGADRGSKVRGSTWLYTLAGLALGASLYTYLAARLMPFVLGLFFVYLLLAHRRIEWGILLALVVAAAVAAPLFLYLNAHPSAEIRIGQLDRPLRALLDGDPGPLFDRISETFLMVSFHGDTFIPYNIPGKPLLDPLPSLLFYAGLFLALWRWKRPAYALALLWLVIGLSPALITGVEAANLRAIAAQPMVYLFPALTLDALGRWLQARTGSRMGFKLAAVGGSVLFVVVGIWTWCDYFLRWADDRDVRVHYHADLVAIADYVQAHPVQTFVISALYPGQYHDPRVIEAELEGDDNRLRWVDGRGGWVLPSDEDVAFVVPAAVPLDPLLVSLLPSRVERVERVTVRANDWNPTFDIYHWRRQADPFPQPLAQIGEQLALLDAVLRSPRVAPGAMVEIVTIWRITDLLPVDRDGVLFAQVLGPDGTVVAQQDRLDVPSWNWHSGDRFIQLLRISLPTDLPSGTYRLIVGVYTTPDRVDAVLAGHEPDPAMSRLPVLVDGQVVGDFFELPAVKVKREE